MYLRGIRWGGVDWTDQLRNCLGMKKGSAAKNESVSLQALNTNTVFSVPQHAALYSCALARRYDSAHFIYGELRREKSGGHASIAQIIPRGKCTWNILHSLTVRIDESRALHTLKTLTHSLLQSADTSVVSSLYL
jgi:hypothetical protein